MSDERRDDDGRDDRDDLDLVGRRGRKPTWLATYGQPLWRILLLLLMLLGIVVLRKPCAEGVAGFIGNFSEPAQDGGAGPARTGPDRDAAPRH